MNPEQLAKSGTEHAEQRALFCWANMAEKHGFLIASQMESYAANSLQMIIKQAWQPVPVLKWLHAIPNAGARGNKVAAAQLKAEGVKAGVADIFLPVPILDGIHGPILRCGLYIELKRAGGRLSDVTGPQEKFRDFVVDRGYRWRVAFGWRAAATIIQEYLGS